MKIVENNQVEVVVDPKERQFLMENLQKQKRFCTDPDRDNLIQSLATKDLDRIIWEVNDFEKQFSETKDIERAADQGFWKHRFEKPKDFERKTMW